MTRWRPIEEIKDDIPYPTLWGSKNERVYYCCEQMGGTWYENYGEGADVKLPTHFLEITPPSEKEIEREKVINEIKESLLKITESPCSQYEEPNFDGNGEEVGTHMVYESDIIEKFKRIAKGALDKLNELTESEG